MGEIQLPPDRIAEICRRYSVRELSIFGSAARGDTRADSDVDLLVEFAPGARVGLIRFAHLAQELEAVTGRAVDLVTRSGLKPWIQPEVVREARLLYAA